MICEGSNPHAIAERLTAEKVFIPRAYLDTTYGKYSGRYNPERAYDWHTGTVASILRNKVYIGSMIGHKRTSKSFKNKKIVDVPPEEWIEVENTHEAIIDRETWDIVQKMVSVKKRVTKNGFHQMFVGLVKCHDCGHSLSYNAGVKGSQGSFICNYAKWSSQKYCTWHYISYRALYRIVLTEIQKHTLLLKKSRSEFEAVLAEQMKLQSKNQLTSLKQEKSKLEVRQKELQRITKKLYEDNALSRITDGEYKELISEYAAEKQDVTDRISGITEQLTAEQNCLENAGRFRAVVEKYIGLEELNQKILNELIEKIEVYEGEKIDGKRRQKVKIYYRFVGCLP